MRRFMGLMIAALLAGLSGAATAGPLDLKVPYTADSVIGRGDNLRTGKLWRTPNAMRHEWIERGVKQNVIVRFDQNLVWSQLPGTNVVVETDLAGLAALPIAALNDPANLRETAVGQETIEGMRVTKYRVATAPGAASSFEGHVWRTAEGIVLKIEGTGVHQGKAGEIHLAFRNIRVGAVDERLFELPANAQKMQVKGDDAAALADMIGRLQKGRGK